MFPKWMFHKDKSKNNPSLWPAGHKLPSHAVVLFNSEADLKAAGPGWVESPEQLNAVSASLDEEIGKAKPKEKSK